MISSPTDNMSMKVSRNTTSALRRRTKCRKSLMAVLGKWFRESSVKKISF